jgi:hypothetical protein
MDSVNLSECIYKEMDIFFVALNAPVKSNTNKHWFSGSLSFWNLLFRSGLIKEQILDPLIGDVKVFKEHSINYNNWVYGITDLDRETVETNSSNVKTDKAQVARIISILEKCKVKKLCLVHSKVAKEFESQGYITRNYKAGKNVYGKVGKYKGTEIFEVPFHNASIPNKELYYNQLIDTPLEKIDYALKERLKPSVSQFVSNTKKPISGISIILPSPGNSITETDIIKTTLRITVEFKSFFRPNSGRIQIQINNQISDVSYTEREGKSDLLRIGKTSMADLDIEEGDSVRITRLNQDLFDIRKK